MKKLTEAERDEYIADPPFISQRVEYGEEYVFQEDSNIPAFSVRAGVSLIVSFRENVPLLLITYLQALLNTYVPHFNTSTSNIGKEVAHYIALVLTDMVERRNLSKSFTGSWEMTLHDPNIYYKVRKDLS